MTLLRASFALDRANSSGNQYQHIVCIADDGATRKAGSFLQNFVVPEIPQEGVQNRLRGTPLCMMVPYQSTYIVVVFGDRDRRLPKELVSGMEGSRVYRGPSLCDHPRAES